MVLANFQGFRVVSELLMLSGPRSDGTLSFVRVSNYPIDGMPWSPPQLHPSRWELTTNPTTNEAKTINMYGF